MCSSLICWHKTALCCRFLGHEHFSGLRRAGHGAFVGDRQHSASAAASPAQAGSVRRQPLLRRAGRRALPVLHRLWCAQHTGKCAVKLSCPRIEKKKWKTAGHCSFLVCLIPRTVKIFNDIAFLFPGCERKQFVFCAKHGPRSVEGRFLCDGIPARKPQVSREAWRRTIWRGKWCVAFVKETNQKQLKIYTRLLLSCTMKGSACVVETRKSTLETFQKPCPFAGAPLWSRQHERDDWRRFSGQQNEGRHWNSG